MKKSLPVFIIGVLLLTSVTYEHALAATAYDDEATFLSAVNTPTLIDFEGQADPGEFIFLGDPGEFSESGVTFTNNSQMFLQNNNSYGTDSFLSPQGADPHIVQIVLPADTVAVGFSYSSAAASAQVDGGESFDLPAVAIGSLGFFGITSDTPIPFITVTVAGPGTDIDNFYFAVEPGIGGGSGGSNVLGGGQIDTNFGTDGVVLLDSLFGVDIASMFGLGVQPGGGIIVAGRTSVEGGEPVITVARLHQNGALDVSFGTGGVRNVDVNPGAEDMLDMAILADGSILLAGSDGTSGAGELSVIMKLDSAGDLDAAFGAGGIATRDISTGSEGWERIVVRNDGKLIVGTLGLRSRGLLADGSPDISFGFNGIGVATQFEPFASYGLAQKSNGKIVSGGALWPSSSFKVMQLLEDWQGVDVSFGTDGQTEVNITPGNDALLDLVVDPQDRIVAVGLAGILTSAAIRLLANGSLDPSFGSGGIRVFDDIPDRTVYVTKMSLRPDGGMLFAGSAWATSGKFELFVVSLNADGSLDESFAGQGWQEIDVAAVPDPGAIFIAPFRSALALHPDGKIIVMDWECACMAMLKTPPWKDSVLPAVRSLADVNGNNHTDLGVRLRDFDADKNKLYVMDGGDGNIIKTVSFGPETARGYATIPDTTGDLIPEAAILVEGSLFARVKDVVNGTLLGKPAFSANFDPVAVFSVGPDLAVVGRNASNEKVRAQIKDIVSGALVSNIAFSKSFIPFDAVAVDNVGDSEATEVAVLGIDSNGNIRAQVKDSQSGNLISKIKFNKAFTPLAFIAVPDANGDRTNLAVLGRSESGVIQAQVKRVSDGTLVGKVKFSKDYNPRAFVSFADSNGSGGGEIAVIGVNNAGKVRAQAKEIMDGTAVSVINFSRKYPPVDAIAINGAAGTARNEIVVLGENAAGELQVQIKDLLTGNLVSKTIVP